MKDDLLARAARALREETTGDDASARFTRSRIMASVHDERVKRRTRWAFLIPIAATFVAASAYGAATGKTREVLQVITHALGIHQSETAPPEPTPPRAVAPRVAPVPPPLTRCASSRMPKYGVHSAPAYVVGTAVRGSSSSAETALVVSIALPPPSPTRASAPSSLALATALSTPARSSWDRAP